MAQTYTFLTPDTPRHIVKFENSTFQFEILRIKHAVRRKNQSFLRSYSVKTQEFSVKS